MNETYYQLLGIPTDAEEREIRRAYHRLARELHPDKAESPEKARDAEQQFARISTAYNILKDPGHRSKYDERSLKKSNNGTSAAETPPPARTATASVLSASRPAASTNPPSSAGSNRPARGGARKSGGNPGLTPARIAIAQKAFAKGIQLCKARDHAKAVEFFEAAIANNDTEPSYFANLGLALIEAKKSASRAIDSLQKAIELDPYNQNFRFNLAHVYETIGSKSNAQKVYEEILRWEPDNQMAQQLLRKLNAADAGFFGKLSTRGSGLLSRVRERLNK